MLSTSVWLEAAQRANMRPGQSRRFGHDCGPGDVVKVTRDPDGIAGYCHRCSDSYKHFIKKSFAEIVKSLNARREAEHELSQSLKLPYDCTPNLPADALLWLSKAGIRQEEIKDYGITYSPKLQRVVIPVVQDGKLVAIQARWLGPLSRESPKYLNFGPRTCFSSRVSGRDWDILCGADASCQDSRPKIGQRSFAVFTEDILSAVRVGRLAQAYALTGTSVPLSELIHVVAGLDTCVLWLDGDGAGIKGAGKLLKSIGLLKDDVRVLTSQRDPKAYPDRLIHKYIQEVMKPDVRNYRTPADEVPGLPLTTPTLY
jgi:hypothetical protein